MISAARFSGGVSFVPLAEAGRHCDAIRVPHDEATIKSVPTVKPDDGELTQAEEEPIYDHYGLLYRRSRSDSGLPEYEDEDEDAVERFHRKVDRVGGAG